MLVEAHWTYGRVITALVTPFTPQGELDRAAARALASDLARRGSDGLVVAGTTGESPTLSEREKLDLCEAVRTAVDGRSFVWLNTGTADTAASIRLTAMARSAGAQGVMAVVPYYSKPPQQGLIEHFRSIGQATDLPMMVYNVPGRTATNLLPRTLEAVARSTPNLVAVKEASHDLEQAAEIRSLLPPPFALYSGEDGLTLPMLAIGGDGVVSVASHLVPERIKEMMDRFWAGEVAEATRIHLALLPLVRALFVSANPIPVKYALGLVGRSAGRPRPPLCELDEAGAVLVRQALRECGLIQN